MDKTAAFEAGVIDAMDKVAKEDRPEAGWLGRQAAQTRAMRLSNKGPGMALAHPELVKKRLKSGIVGGAGGAGLGAGGGALVGLLSRGKIKPGRAAALGAAIGGGGGYVGGIGLADKKHMASKGIKTDILGLNPRLSDEAKKKYLHKKYKGGGYGN